MNLPGISTGLPATLGRRIQAYYMQPQVRARMLEYMGGGSMDALTAEYLTAGDRFGTRHRVPRPVSELSRFWDGGLDISRSLWDAESLLIHLDFEYVNFDSAAAAFREPARAFDLQEPLIWAADAVFRDYGARPLHLLSGRGHHFVWRVRQSSPAFHKLAEIGRVNASLEQLYERPHRPNGRSLPPMLGRASAGLSLVMEYLAHRIKQIGAPMCELPVQLTAVEVGPGNRGREMLSVDISEYGDPLTTRVIRVPFSLYLKPWQQEAQVGRELVETMPPVFLIPSDAMNWRAGLQVRCNMNRVAGLARTASTEIPEQEWATENLIAAYLRSTVAKFHAWYYSEEPHPPERWPDTYDAMPMDKLPPCAQFILEHPNDLLLKPAGIERIVRVMLSLGWHPRHIAGLVRSKFERDFQWGDQWTGYDAGLRAEFYTRLFSGLFVTGRDDLVDFNCQSAKEERFCFVEWCSDNLQRYKTSLLDRRKHERLACRPFNGLFLPEEHL